MRRSIITREFKRKLFRNIKFNWLKNKKSFNSQVKSIEHSVEKTLLLKYKFQLQYFNSDFFANKMKNRCYISGRAKGFSRFFGLSRHNIKNLFSKNCLSGVRKSTW